MLYHSIPKDTVYYIRQFKKEEKVRDNQKIADLNMN
jgi:hypothetical protein